MTYTEVKLWNELKQGQMMGYDFDRQRPMLNYIVDFYCKDLMLAIEVDGITHEDETVAEKDPIRQQAIEQYGVQFLRFDALDIVHNIKNVLRTIEDWILAYEEKNGISAFALRKREALKFPRERRRK